MPTTPWGKKPQLNTSASGFPGLTPTTATATTFVSPGSQYDEIQKDEVFALSSIYGEDFHEVETTGAAWKKSEPRFEIRIKAPSDADLAMTLAVTLTATYPRTPPLLNIKGDEGLREGTKYKLQRIIETKPKELVAEEQAMIMDIVNSCQEVLEDAAQAAAAGLELPSLEEERAAHEEVVAKLAEEQKEEEEKRKKLESMEEERMLGSLVQDELKRQREKAKETKLKNRPQSATLPQSPMDRGVKGQGLNDLFSFDQAINFVDASGNLFAFQVVIGKALLRHGPVSKCYMVRALVSGGEPPIVVLKQTDLDTVSKDHNSYKKQLQMLEAELEQVKKIRHQNIVELLGFKVHKKVDETGESESSWTVSILSEFAEKGSLEELLDMAGNLGVNKVRSWTIDLLDALRYIHDHGIVHQDIHCGNILLFRDAAGDVRPKLADVGYERKLHSLCSKTRPADTLAVAKSAYWIPPELANSEHPQYTQKTDVWDFGIMFLQMAFGLTVFRKYSSPTALMESLALSHSLKELVHRLFKADAKKRPRAFELSSSEFLATDAPILEDDISSAGSRLGSISLMPGTPRKQRHDSMNAGISFSRYLEDFVEEGRLGKGGFGEVVKARKKLDGQIYAIKKITQKSSDSLTEVLKEVRLLSQLSHPYVVRYYNTWTEEVLDTSDTEDETTTTDVATTQESESAFSSRAEPELDFGTSTGGLDFMSSSGYPAIEFGYDDGSDTDASAEEDEDGQSTNPEDQNNDNGKQNNNLALTRTRSGSRFHRPFKTILYISMEYCEKRTLRDLIRRDLYKDKEEVWRLFRQILEGLAHIHGLNVVHRDLKPENVFIDAASNVRIGDFGLATTGQYNLSDKTPAGALHLGSDMTKSVGTAAYVAPEVRSSVGGTYTSKVDMYSLGVIFFEMCYRPIAAGMERVQVVEALRLKEPTLPTDFDIKREPVQASIILSLLNHSPKERPTSSELLQSGQLPVQMENETIRQTLAGLSDSKSPYYQKMMGALFSRPTNQAQDLAWDMGGVNHKASDLMLQGLVRQRLIAIFRRHGAVETPRSVLFPRSGHYGPNVVQLLDSNGTLVQLPYDLTLPHARAIAKNEPAVSRSFAFGPVFRDKQLGGQPQSFGEVDFDIVSTDSLDLALKEAEVIKVLDEITCSFPSLEATQMCFHINHSDLLALIFDFCQIEPSIRQHVSDTLSKLNVQQWTWQKIKAELRSPLIGVSATSVDDLQRFDFRDTPVKALHKLKMIFDGTDNFEKASSAIAHLKEVIEYTKLFGLRSKLYINPLGSLKEKFCKGGIIFSCLYDRKIRDVFAAGGRYDSLIRQYQHRTSSESRHAVGFNLAWEKIARLPKAGPKGFLKKQEEDLSGPWNSKRCDVLVASHDPVVLRTVGIEVVQQLWAHDISAELAQDSRSPEDLLSKYREDNHCWIVIIKQDSVLKIKSMDRKDVADADIPLSQLLAWFRTEIRERSQREGSSHRVKLQRAPSQPDQSHPGESREQEVRVLVAGTKSKKSNRRNIVEQAQARAAALVQSFLDGPIAAIETTDHVMDLIRETSLSDPESWRKVTQSVPTAEKRYIGEIHDLVSTLAHQHKDTTRHAFIYNFRTGTCMHYDLGT